MADTVKLAVYVVVIIVAFAWAIVLARRTHT